MAASSQRVDLVLNSTINNVPSCPHGPALLFERFEKDGSSRQFFACSAYRDRKQCPFFKWASDVKKKNGREASDDTDQKAAFSHSECYKRFGAFKKLPQSQRTLCCSCSRLLLPEEVGEHSDPTCHVQKSGISLSDLQHPTTLFTPQENNKTFAQYLFSSSAVDFTISTVETLGFTHLLCVGAPRIHEAVDNKRKAGKTKLTSLLLDLDTRYAQVYSPKELCVYNMFNHHFFDKHGERAFTSFLREGGEGLILVTDPPFGGMVEALAATFSKIEQAWRDFTGTDASLPILWFFPYFMEKRIRDHMPSLKMLDYKVDYENHTLFNTKDRKSKKGSPVRIFTNISPSSFPLPAEDGYWYCEVCERYSAPENKHCDICQACTSKDGTTYIHCDQCKRCVKSTRVHCPVCNICDLPSHKCGQALTQGCHVCGSLEHKRRDCPQRHGPVERSGKKRNQGKESADVHPKPKKKRKK